MLIPCGCHATLRRKRAANLPSNLTTITIPASPATVRGPFPS